MLPFIHIFGLTIPMYGLLMAIGLFGGGAIAAIRAKQQGLCVENLIIMAAFAVGFALIGGDLLFVFATYSLKEIGAIIREGRWELIFSGGIVFYGALIGGVVGAWIGSRVAKDDVRRYLDAAVPVIPLGHAVGRIGCFCAGCCYGMPTDGPLGVVYTNPVGGAPVGVRLLPVQLFEAGADILIAIILMIVSRKAKSRYTTSYLYCVLYGMVRFILEFFRYDAIRGSIGGLSTSQWVSIGLILAAVICYSVTGLRHRHSNAKMA
jgi:phosphatidylglycerol:prolipoprotein diacylglycerol transferase